MARPFTRARAIVLAACLAAGVGAVSGTAPAVADVANPGTIAITATSGSGNLGATTFTVDPAQPIKVDGSVDGAGTISVPTGGVHFPTTQQTSSGVTVTVSISNASPATGTIDTATGAATITMPLTINIAGIPFGGGCHVGPFTVPLTTGTSGALTGTPYDQATGSLRLVAAGVTVPGSSGCGPGQSGVDGSIAGTGNFDMAFAVTPILRAGSGNVTPALAVSPQTGPAPLATTLDASASTAATGSITGYAWDFGDGATASGASATTSHTYTNPGVYTAKVNVSASTGDVAQKTKVVVVTGTYRKVSVAFTGGTSYTNEGPLRSGNVVVAQQAGAVKSVRGAATIAGTSGGDATVAFNANGFFGLPIFIGSIAVSDPGAHFAQTTTLLFTRATPLGPNGAQGRANWFKVTGPFQLAGYTLNWSVADVGQGSVPLPPSAAFTATPSTALAPQAVAFDASASQDPTPGGGIQSYAWDFGDGTTATGATTTKSFTNAGTYVVQLSVISNAGLSDSTTRLVRIDPLVAPANFRLSGRGGGGVAWDYAYADLAWDPVAGADNYEVERVFIAGCIANGNRGPVLLSGSATTWRDSGEVFSNPSMCRGSQYKWHIRTVNNGARSDWSPWVEPGPL